MTYPEDAEVGIRAEYDGLIYETITQSDETIDVCEGCPFTDDKGGCISPKEIDDATEYNCSGIIWKLVGGK